jgi:hypothetical protein
MNRVVIGMDPHKRTATIEVMAGDEAVAGRGMSGRTDRLQRHIVDNHQTGPAVQESARGRR